METEVLVISDYSCDIWLSDVDVASTWASLFCCHAHQAVFSSPLGIQEGMLKGESEQIITHPFSVTVHFKWVIGHSVLYIYIGSVVKVWDWLSVFSQNQILVPAG